MTKSDGMLAIRGISVAMDNTDFLLQNVVSPHILISFYVAVIKKNNAQNQLMEEKVFLPYSSKRRIYNIRKG